MSTGKGSSRKRPRMRASSATSAETIFVGLGDLSQVPYEIGCEYARCAWCGYPGHLARNDIPQHRCDEKPANRSRACPVVVDGERFDSVWEARRWAKLRFLERKQIISGLLRQPRYPFVLNGVKISEYRPDFRYVFQNEPILEDVKGYETQTFKLKLRMMSAFYPGLMVILVR